MVLGDLAELYAAAGARDKAVLAAVEALEKLPHAPLGPGRERAESMLTDLLTGC